MQLYSIRVVQNAYVDKGGQPHNEYHFYSPDGWYLGGVLLPADGQLTYDAKALEAVCRVLGTRWGLVQLKKSGRP